MRHEYVKSYVRFGTYMTVQTLLTAALISFIVGFSGATLAKIFLAVGLNILSIPLALTTDVLSLPLWVWYIIVIEWVINFSLLRTATFERESRNAKDGRISDVDDELLP